MGISGLLPTASPIYLYFSLWIHKSFSLKRTLILACFLERKHVEKKLENQVQKQAQFHWRHVTCSQTIPHVPVTTSLITHDGAFPPPPIFVVQRDTDALPDVELAVPRLQQQRVLEVLLDHVHLALLVYEVQELSGLGGNEDAFTCGNQNGS